jgi:hypothetical protein
LVDDVVYVSYNTGIMACPVPVVNMFLQAGGCPWALAPEKKPTKGVIFVGRETKRMARNSWGRIAIVAVAAALRP